ncbi:MAG: AmmeMemoRadiSam system radical SAM enzyme [Candidatus Zixiibacteriota bacterium]
MTNAAFGIERASASEARYWEPRADKAVVCTLCPHLCHIGDGLYGVCGVRRNDDGKLKTLIYGLSAAVNVDPIEKKPLFHFLPGTQSLSIATVGCSFRCPFCQNYDLSQVTKGKNRELFGRPMEPGEIVALAKQAKASSVAFTYSEPTIFYEYAYDCAKLAAEEGIRGVFVSNGFITEDPITAIRPYIHAYNVDIKSFNPDFYRKVLGARLEPVLEAIKVIHREQFWLEIATVVIPGQNDSDHELAQIAEFIGELSVDIPWHVSAFHPDYKMTNVPRTTVESIERAISIGRDAGLRYVYSGNTLIGDTSSTRCPGCQTRVIHRVGFQVLQNQLKDGKCPDCGTAIAGVWS